MKTKYILIFLAIAALCFTACKPEDKPTETTSWEVFLRKATPGLYEADKTLYSFRKINDQLYVNPSTHTYRIVSDDGLTYMQAVLDAPVPAVGEKVNAVITSKGIESVGNRGSSEFEVMKKDEENCWLWCEEDGLGLLLFYIP